MLCKLSVLLSLAFAAAVVYADSESDCRVLWSSIPKPFQSMQPDKLMAMMQKNDKVDINAFKKLYLDCLRHLEGARFKKASASLFDNANRWRKYFDNEIRYKKDDYDSYELDSDFRSKRANNILRKGLFV